MADDEEAERSPEQVGLWWHRYDAARSAGLDDIGARLAADAEVDSHALKDLIDQGCPPSTALRISL